MRDFLLKHDRIRWFAKWFIPLAVLVLAVLLLNDPLKTFLGIVPSATLMIVGIPLVSAFIKKFVDKLFPEPKLLLDERKIRISVGSQEYDKTNGCYRVTFYVTNSNAESAISSRIIFGVVGIQKQAKLAWYWRGIYDSGAPYEKVVEQLNLENGSPHAILLEIKPDSEIKRIDFGSNSVVRTLLVPLQSEFQLRISVVGLNHKKRDAVFKIRLAGETFQVWEPQDS